MVFLTDKRKCVSAHAGEIELRRAIPADWRVNQLVFIGAVRDVSGKPMNVLAFRVCLCSVQTNREIELRVDAPALVRLLQRIAPETVPTPRTITKVIEDLLTKALSPPNCSFDPLRASQLDLGEAEMNSFVPKEGQRYSK
jgi:hypothetical protein